MKKPDLLFLMCDQFRFDCIHALGNAGIDTPNLDRLAARGLTFTNAYSTCPVCVPARYTARTGREPFHTGCYENEIPKALDGQPEGMRERCGPYLAEAMRERGYETFGIGKFHTMPQFDEDLGYDLQMNTEELWSTKEERGKDAFARFLAERHPEYSHLEQLHGERTNMYYMPQLSPLPAELTVESFVAGEAVKQIEKDREKPYFGFVSFVGPHPPCAPPIPYNRYYNPDHMPLPYETDSSIDHMDEQIPWMNHLIWAEGMNDFLIRNLKSRYYGEITYIDNCIGRILDAVEAKGNDANTLICFFSDHGDHLGDHHAWQKESYFEASCHVPFLLSWPERWQKGVSDQLVCLTDLFGIATAAAGAEELRDGHPVLRVLAGEGTKRDDLFACYGRPGTPRFKCMVRSGSWKYIWIANGGREQLFDLSEHRREDQLANEEQPDVLQRLRRTAEERCRCEGLQQALSEEHFRTFPYKERPRVRIHQFDESSGVTDFML